jgi:hypothetical protein
MWIPVRMIVEEAKKTKAQMVPSTLSHCVLAVQKKGHDTRSAWNICRASLTRQGYLKGPYNERGKASDLKMTQKGTRRSMRHSMERDAPEKFKRFKKDFAKIERSV